MTPEPMQLAVISRQFAKEFRVILNEASEAVLHAGDILSKALAELVVDALVLLLNRTVEIARQAGNLNNSKTVRRTLESYGVKNNIDSPLSIELRLALLLARSFHRFPVVGVMRHCVAIVVSLASILLQFRARERQVGFRDVQLFRRCLPEIDGAVNATKETKRLSVTHVKHGLLLVVELLQLLAGLLLRSLVVLAGLDVLDIAGNALVAAHQDAAAALGGQQVALQTLNLIAVLLCGSIK